ncbi:MAG: phytanoyl-CoA dioxygenase family protein [Legionellaceae bacterium]|nr:phytanoyl-CoA dioxygenase family protein [Legionellaceae bacterium]MBP9774366.1 phytanoyl-CoA dioxygenase family protein [Legionellaceae bacterium]
MLKLKEQVFGDKGYSVDCQLSIEELSTFRQIITQQWLSTFRKHHPHLFDEAQSLGIENYHLIANKIDHQALWPKRNRVLPQDWVHQIKQMSFLSLLREEFGDFAISDIYDTKQHYGEEEIYWRLVRPGIPSDVGSLHKDGWFHGSFNGGYGMFPDGTTTVKIWIPIYCEPGKNGLRVAQGSHLKEFKYRVDITSDGTPRPQLEEDLTINDAPLISVEPGNMIIFNENVLHGGSINLGNQTRVSAEITMVLPKTTMM